MAGLQRDRARTDAEFLQRFRPNRTTAVERAARSRAARQQTRARAGVCAAEQANGQRAGAAARARSIAVWTQRARGLGYPGVEEMLTATAGLVAGDLAARLGVSAKQVYDLRKRYGRASPGGRSVDRVPQRPSTRPALTGSVALIDPAL